MRRNFWMIIPFGLVTAGLLALLIYGSQQNAPEQSPAFSTSSLASPTTENARSSMPFTSPVTVSLTGPTLNVFAPFLGLGRFGQSMERMQEKMLDRTAPITPTGIFNFSFTTDVSGKCDVKITGMQYRPDFDLAHEAMEKCGAFSTAVMERVHPLPMPEPIPAPTPEPAVTIEYPIAGTDFVLKAVKGERVIALLNKAGPRAQQLDQKFVVVPVFGIDDVWIEDNIIHISYIGPGGKLILFDYPVPEWPSVG